jgi:hypothetical protein
MSVKDDLLQLNKEIAGLNTRIAVLISDRKRYLVELKRHKVSNVAEAASLLAKLRADLKTIEGRRRKLKLKIRKSLDSIGNRRSI